MHHGWTVCCGPWLLGRSTITEWNIQNNNTFCEQTLTDAFHVTMMMSVSSTLLDWVLDNIHLVFKPFRWIFQLSRESFTFPNFWDLWQRSISSAWCCLHHDWGGLLCFWSSHQRTFFQLTLDSWDLQSQRCFCIIIRFGLFSDLFSELTGGFLYLHGVTVRHCWILGIAVPV